MSRLPGLLCVDDRSTDLDLALVSSLAAKSMWIPVTSCGKAPGMVYSSGVDGHCVSVFQPSETVAGRLRIDGPRMAKWSSMPWQWV